MARNAAIEAALQRTRILVVEDEGIIARDIQNMLQALGYELTGVASCAQGALQSLTSDPADLVLMDIRIRGPIDGIEAAASIRERFQIPVVYLTAHTDTKTLDRAEASGPVGYIAKPYAVLDIKLAVENALRREETEPNMFTAPDNLWSPAHDAHTAEQSRS